jgi:hypothetical protein
VEPYDAEHGMVRAGSVQAAVTRAFQFFIRERTCSTRGEAERALTPRSWRLRLSGQYGRAMPWFSNAVV